MSVSLPYGALVGYLSGIGGALAGFTLAMALVYPMFARFGRTRTVYKAVPEGQAPNAGTRTDGSPN